MMQASKCVLVIDTSLLCVWLKVPKMETCGETGAAWDFAKVDKRIKDALRDGYTLVLPLASIIETGNHIAHAPQYRRERALGLGEMMTKAADAQTPWAAFQHQAELWGADQLKELATTWPPLAECQLALGDATIARIGEYYAKLGCTVKFLTADRQLNAYEPPPPALVPRRRQR
jgi:hypothetical protein